MSRVATRQGKIREKWGFFKLREMLGNFEICQGKIEFWKTSWKKGKIQFPGVRAKNLPILGHQVPIFSFFPITMYMLP